ncbi:MAG TPA: pilus assembly protein PilM, partial [Candidatus Paceibacterota bacterium]|nr:pilus assembly protein PilM [Candidatus Paceibacterota bacterium]
MHLPSFAIFRKRPVALFLSDHTIVLLRLAPNGTVVSYARANLPQGIMQDGAVLDRKKLVYQVRELALSAAPTPISLVEDVPVMLAIPESKTFTHLFTFPKASVATEDALKEAVKNEAMRIIPIDFARIYWDMQVITTPDETKTTVLFAGTLKDVVQDYIAVCEECHMFPVAIDMEAIALSRSLLGSIGGSTMVVDIGSRTTTVAFYDEAKRINMSITIPIAGDAFNRAIMEHMNVTIEEAEALKRRDGFDRANTENRVLVILQERVQAILREIEKALSYYESKFGKRISHIVLAGGSALIKDLDAYLQINLGRDLSVADPLRGLDRRAERVFGPTPAVLLAPAIGLALRGLAKDPSFSDINLLHGWEGEQWAERERIILSHWRVLAIPIFIASLLLLAYVYYDYIYLPKERLREEATERIMLRVDPLPDGSIAPSQTATSSEVTPNIELPATTTPDDLLESNTVVEP